MSKAPHGSHGPLSDALLRVLREGNGTLVSRQDLLNALYSGAAETPLDENNVLRVSLWRLRRKGIAIEQTTAYRLVPRRGK